jgi:hypothetical protein
MVTRKATDTIHRVVKFSPELRAAFAAKREQDEIKVADLLAASLERELPRLVEQVLAAGFRPRSSKSRPARLPLNAGLLDLLAKAAAATGQDQVALLTACLTRTCGDVKAKPTRRGRKAVAK